MEKKIRESWDTRSDHKGKGRAVQQAVLERVPASETRQDEIQEEGKPNPPTAPSGSSSSSSSSSSDEDSSGSDMDPERDAVSSKVRPVTMQPTQAPSKPCRFFQQGRCSFGEKCRDRHDASQSSSASQPLPPKKRKRPRLPSPNPFEAPHLLRALLRNEIAQHINYVAQVVRFLVRNEYLAGFEEREGEAEAQTRQRQLVVEEPCEDERPAEGLDTACEGQQVQSDEVGLSSTQREELGKPLVDGGLPTLGTSLIEPEKAPLKPLHSLALPPEPDPMAFMDPLRANDAKPLLHAQYRQIACDGGIRALLLDEQGKVAAAMTRALSTLDALPSYAHRSSAIELILGVSEQSQLHPHQIGPTFVRGDRNPSGSRVIGESELFRCGLRVGPLELGKLRQLASRISSVLGGPSFEVDDGVDEMQPWWDKQTREEVRLKKWAKEADWRDEMRRLGLDVD